MKKSKPLLAAMLLLPLLAAARQAPDGDTRVPLDVSDDGKSYSVPVGNKHYGNDVLIEVELM